ncbi:hypothetical protein [Sphingomonas sp.]|uniref:hypothetical protein n=1 Tax=Sphingomonas sp. TaxID=28214 RepID=UPI0028AD2BA2|nr:hypothetical protein [Sphingomonas sp.]
MAYGRAFLRAQRDATDLEIAEKRPNDVVSQGMGMAEEQSQCGHVWQSTTVETSNIDLQSFILKEDRFARHGRVSISIAKQNNGCAT